LASRCWGLMNLAEVPLSSENSLLSSRTTDESVSKTFAITGSYAVLLTFAAEVDFPVASGGLCQWDLVGVKV
jgi:hypothetical protein